MMDEDLRQELNNHRIPVDVCLKTIKRGIETVWTVNSVLVYRPECVRNLHNILEPIWVDRNHWPEREFSSCDDAKKEVAERVKASVGGLEGWELAYTWHGDEPEDL